MNEIEALQKIAEEIRTAGIIITISLLTIAVLIGIRSWKVKFVWKKEQKIETVGLPNSEETK